MHAVCRLLTVAVVVAVPALVHAQETERKAGPEKGTWGGEASTAGVGLTIDAGQSAALLRFMTPRTALVGGLSFVRVGTPNVANAGGISNFQDNDYSAVALRLGVRRYGGTGLGLRPIIGGGVLINSTSSGGSRDTGVGGYGEAGAAWFFNPHVSLGVLGGVSASRRNSAWTVGGTLARLTGAVYF